MNFSFSVLTYALIYSWVNDQKRVLLLVLYSDAAYCVSFTLVNSSSFIFEVSAVNLGDRLGGINLGGGCEFF